MKQIPKAYTEYDKLTIQHFSKVKELLNILRATYSRGELLPKLCLKEVINTNESTFLKLFLVLFFYNQGHFLPYSNENK